MPLNLQQGSSHTDPSIEALAMQEIEGEFCLGGNLSQSHKEKWRSVLHRPMIKWAGFVCLNRPFSRVPTVVVRRYYTEAGGLLFTEGLDAGRKLVVKNVQGGADTGTVHVTVDLFQCRLEQCLFAVWDNLS